MGGLGALMAGSEDPEYSVLLVWLQQYCPSFCRFRRNLYYSTPIQLQIGSNDGLIPPETSDLLSRLNSKQKSYVEIKGGNTCGFWTKQGLNDRRTGEQVWSIRATIQRW